MAYQQKDGDIAVFFQREKKSDRSPDWKGTAIVDGKEMEVSFWKKSDTMLAGQIKPKWKPDHKAVKESFAPNQIDAGMDKGVTIDSDEIPF
jgi:hypothetical protein